MNKQLVMALLASGALVGLSGCSGGGGDTTIIIEAPTNDGGSGGTPAPAPAPVTTLKTPSGKPAALTSSAKAMVLADVCSEGLTTTVFPTARQGARETLRILSGELKGVMIATTPRGS